MEKHTFVDGSLKQSLITMLVLLPVIAVLIYFFSQYTFIIIIVACALGLWYAGQQKESVITCDADGCSIESKTFWTSRKQTTEFLWRDVTATKFILTPSFESTAEVHFEVDAEGETIEILRSTIKTSNQNDNIIAFINEATPHLPYIWVKLSRTLVKDVSNFEEMEKAGDYSKISRIRIQRVTS